VDLLAGKTAHIDLGGLGRPVIGQLQTSNPQAKAAWRHATVWIVPEDLLRVKDPHFTATVNRDGSLCVDDVPQAITARLRR
jgi:hypothetical protein